MRTKNSIRNFITVTISNIINFAFIFIAQTIFIKILGIEYVGLNGLFNNVLTVLSLFELGIGNAIIYNLYKYIHNDNKEQIKSLMQFYKKAYHIIALSILIVGILIIPLLQFIIKDVTADINVYFVYILFLLSTVASYILAYKRSIIFASQRSYIINIIHTIYIIILNMTQLLIIYITKNYYLYIITKIVFILLENIIINVKANKDYPYLLDKNVKPLDKKNKNDIINRVKALFIHKTSAIVTQGTDNILISAFFGISTVGLYTSYNYIISSIETFTKNVTYSTSASVGDLLVEEDYKKRYLVFKRINFLNFWITVVTSSCLLFLIEPFITIWLGKKYLLETVVLVTLILNYFQSMMRSTFSTFKDAAGIWVEDKYVPLVQLSLNLIASIICLQLFGICGVFIGTIISSFAVWFYSYPKFIYKQVLHRNYKEYIFYLIKHLLVFINIEIIIYFILLFINIKNMIINIIIRLIISVVIPSSTLYIINKNKEEMKFFIKKIRGKESNNKINKGLRKIYCIFLRRKIKNTDITLISSTCNGCVILHDLHIKYNSPFVNLFVKPKDFIKFCENMEYYLKQKLTFIKEENKTYPVGKLDDIKIYFYHYKTNEEALEQWNRRKKRVNMKNIFIIFTDRDGCTYEDLKRFDKLKYKNKVVFTKKKYDEIKSSKFIPGFEEDESVGRCTSFVNRLSYKRYLDYFDYIAWFNNEKNN